MLLLPVMLAAQVSGVKRLEWIDPQGRKLTSHRDWLSSVSAETDRCRVGLADSDGFDLSVDVVVNAALYPDIASELAQYSIDLVTAGYAARIDTMRGMNHVALRQRLAAIPGLVGAVLVGELPVAWY